MSTFAINNGNTLQNYRGGRLLSVGTLSFNNKLKKTPKRQETETKRIQINIKCSH